MRTTITKTGDPLSRARLIAGFALAVLLAQHAATGAEAPVPLGAAANFSVLAGSTVTSSGATIVNGDLGLWPGTAVTGFPPGIVNGTMHVNDPIAQAAQGDLTIAFNDAAGRTTAPVPVAGNIGGQTLAPGLYKSTSSLAISSGDLTLDGGGNPNAVWIFQIASTFITTPGRQVILAGGAQAANVFWQVGTSATIDTTSVMKGNILADQSISILTGASLEGRALARIGAVTMQGNAMNVPTLTNVQDTADVAVFKTGPTSAIARSNVTYTITVTNRGPLSATNVTVNDALPAGFTYVSAVPNTATVSNGIVRWPAFKLLTAGSSNFTVTATAPAGGGSYTNVAYSTSVTPDPNPRNNSARATTLILAGAITTNGPLVSSAGGPVFNPQTGLYEQTVIVLNTGDSTVTALRLLVGNINGTNGVPRTDVWLWNAGGTNLDGRRFVQYNSALNPGQSVTFKLEFYNRARTPFTNSLEAEAFPPATVTSLTSGAEIDRVFTDLRSPGGPRFVIEWTSLIGRSYIVIYSDDNLATWQPATPSVTASATRTQWYDDGPPKTISKPLSNGSRFYRVILNP